MSDYWENKRDEAGPPDGEPIAQADRAAQIEALNVVRKATTFGDGRDINEDNEEIPEWARPYIRTLKRQVTNLSEALNINHEELSHAFLKGVSSVTCIRCKEHIAVPLINTNEANGGECGACIKAAYEAKAALLDRYCAWIRWRTDNGAVDNDEIELVRLSDAIDAGESVEYPDHWVTTTEESRARIFGRDV